MAKQKVEAKHTPGPLTAHGMMVLDENKTVIAHVHSPRSLQEADANAVLFAAATDMRAALEYVREYLRPQDYPQMWGIVNAVLAKAEVH